MKPLCKGGGEEICLLPRSSVGTRKGEKKMLATYDREPIEGKREFNWKERGGWRSFLINFLRRKDAFRFKRIGKEVMYNLSGGKKRGKRFF